MVSEIEKWEKKQTILVVLAHPDDPEFFCGATIARWTEMGHSIHYCLLTRGDKGSNNREETGEQIAKKREVEEAEAAKVLGVDSIQFFHYPDGYLVPDLAIRKEVVRVIRQVRPDILVTCDPTTLFHNDRGINHPDHRAAGQIVIDATFPAAGNSFYFPELLKEGLEPHSVKEVWLSVTNQANVVIDVSKTWKKKIEALHCHKSQIGDSGLFDERMLTRRTPDSSVENPRFEEKFKRIIFG